MFAFGNLGEQGMNSCPARPKKIEKRKNINITSSFISRKKKCFFLFNMISRLIIIIVLSTKNNLFYPPLYMFGS